MVARRLRNYLKASGGNVAAMFALSLAPVAICMGAAVDYLGASRFQTEIQRVADAAALAAVVSPKKPAEWTLLAAEYMKVDPEIGALPARISSDTQSLTIAVSTSRKTSFLNLGGIDSLPVEMTTTAVLVTKPICLLSLNKSESKSIRIWGSGAHIAAQDCVVHANSTSSTAMSNDSGSTSTADIFCAVGGSSPAGFSPAPKADCRDVTDPYAGLPVPDVSGCDHNGMSINSGSKALEPGIYCGGLGIGQAEVSFAPGVYVMKQGDFKVSGSNAVVIGKGVTIYLYGDKASLVMSGGSDIELSAPTSGDYAGMLFVQNGAGSTGGTSKISGNSKITLVGTSYFPTQTLSVGGSGNFGVTSPYMAFVADKLEFFGNGQITLKFDPKAAGYNHPAPREFWGARLSQ